MTMNTNSEMQRIVEYTNAYLRLFHEEVDRAVRDIGKKNEFGGNPVFLRPWPGVFGEEFC